MKFTSIKFYSILILSIIFVGCGGGGTSSTVQDTQTQTDTNTSTVQDSQTPTDTNTSDDNVTTISFSAVNNLNSNWSQSDIFTADILYPEGILKDNQNNIYTYSSTKNGSTIAKLTDTNKLQLVISTTDAISGLGFQTNKNRFIYTTDTYALYALDQLGNKSLLQFYGVIGNKIVVAEDDSFYTCSGSNNSGLYHYDKDGNKLATIVNGVNICSSLVLNPNETKLYYTSSYDGTVNEVDLQTNNVTTIASNLGIPGTYEPIALAFNDNGELFAFPSANGLYKYTNGQFSKIINSIGGGGDIIWSQKYNSFLMSQGVGANIIAYNTQTSSATNLTHYINGFSIAQTIEGNILVCNNKSLLEEVTSKGLSTYLNLENHSCTHLVTDANDTVYIGTYSGNILKLNDIDKSYTLFASPVSANIVHLTYDSYNNALISVHDVSENTVEIWKTPLDNPNSASKIYTLTDVTLNNNLPVAASDNMGNTYILERAKNKIYKLNINSRELSEFYNAPLENDAIAVPDMIYLPTENALLISTIEDYQMISLDTKTKSVFGTNNGAVDNLAMHINSKNEIVAIHSGQIFKMIHK